MMLPPSKLSAMTLEFYDKGFQTFFIGHRNVQLEKEISSIFIKIEEFCEIRLFFLEFHKEGEQKNSLAFF